MGPLRLRCRCGSNRRFSSVPPRHNKKNTPLGCLFIMGRITGLEPATFGTTNQRSNQLSYIRHTVGHTTRICTRPKFNIGGADRTRTDDPLHAMQVLYQLSYNPGVPTYFICINRKSQINLR